jgi:hypothetical protein
LNRYSILKTPPEQEFDNLIRLAEAKQPPLRRSQARYLDGRDER